MSWRATARELGLRVDGEQREEIATAARRRARGPARAAAGGGGGLRREYPFAFALAADGPLINGVIDLLADEPGGGALVLDYKSDRVGPISISPSSSSATTRSSACYTRSPSCAAARARWRSSHWFLERPHEPVSVELRGERARAARTRRAAADRGGARAAAIAVSPRPAPRPVPDLPGPREAVLVGRGGDAARASAARSGHARGGDQGP